MRVIVSISALKDYLYFYLKTIYMNPEQTTPPGQDQPRYQPNNGGNLITPNSGAVLILGILSIVFCWCYGLLSVIMGIIALVLASSGEKEYLLNPGLYSLSSYKNLKAGKTCAIVGLCLAGISILCIIIWWILFGTFAYNMMNSAFQH